jgi:hypothetical protein
VGFFDAADQHALVVHGFGVVIFHLFGDGHRIDGVLRQLIKEFPSPNDRVRLQFFRHLPRKRFFQQHQIEYIHGFHQPDELILRHNFAVPAHTRRSVRGVLIPRPGDVIQRLGPLVADVYLVGRVIHRLLKRPQMLGQLRKVIAVGGQAPLGGLCAALAQRHVIGVDKGVARALEHGEIHMKPLFIPISL